VVYFGRFFPKLEFSRGFLYKKNIYIIYRKDSEAAMGGGVRSAPFGVEINPKRRVRAAHGRAREAKTH
jgi:hypothetical protein